MAYHKDFDGWHPVKKAVDKKEGLPTFNKGEVWWCRFGINVGFELDGKSQQFHRPVFILEKFNRRSFLAVPLTSNLTAKPHKINVCLQTKMGELMNGALISQLRFLDAKRLQKKHGKMAKSEGAKIRDAVRNMLK